MAVSSSSPISYALRRRSGTAWETVATSVRIAWAGMDGQVLFGVIAWLRTFFFVYKSLRWITHSINFFT